MASPSFYVSPEQLVRDRAEYAQKGISRGRPIAAASCRDGIVLVGENSSATLHKIAEIYDRIGFAGVGRYAEFEALRVAGIRLADTRGFLYDRSDVSARGLANAFAQTLGQIFTHEVKPYEVELLLAEVGADPAQDRYYRVRYDGTLAEDTGSSSIGTERPLGIDARDASADEAVAMCQSALRDVTEGETNGRWEIAILARHGEGRRFSRK